jgi:tellurite resistance protein TerC
MESIYLFPFVEYWWFYIAFLAFVLGMLLLDLGVFHRDDHEVTIRESAIWTAVWISLALVFNYLLYLYSLDKFATDPRLLAVPGFDGQVAAKQVGLEFLTGFVIEKALAIDNIFVFIVIFSYFAIPPKYQHRVLFFGVLGALVFRAIFITLGAVLLQYHWVVLLAGAFLILTGAKILFAPEKAPDPGANPVVQIVRKFMPLTDKYDGNNFFTREAGVLKATPLFLALVLIEFSDIVFAIDSVPAIFAITKEPLIVFSSNIFAILGLRSLFFMIAGIMHMFRFLKVGLGLILVFVGLKMVWLNEAMGGKFPIGLSLGIIGGIITISIIASLVLPAKAAKSSVE